MIFPTQTSVGRLVQTNLKSNDTRLVHKEEESSIVLLTGRVDTQDYPYNGRKVDPA